MDKKQIIDLIQQKCSDKNNRIHNEKLYKFLNNNSDIKQFIIDDTIYIPDTYSEFERVYVFITNKDIKCSNPNCNNIINNIIHRKTCGNKECKIYGAASADSSAKRKRTNIQKYGVENPSQLDTVKEKKKTINLEKYGVENVFQHDDFKKISKQTCMDRYGVEYALQSDIIKEKIKETNLEKYGVESHNQNIVVKEKKKTTNLEKYGVEYYSQTNEYIHKVKQTCMDRYGVEHVLQSDIVKEKIKETNLEKYGVENVFQLKKIQLQIKKTNMEKYGVEYPIQNSDIKIKSFIKIKKTNLKKYGVENILQSEEIKEKIKQKNLEKYGVENPALKHILPENIIKMNDMNWLIEQNKTKTLTEIALELGVTPAAIAHKFKENNTKAKIHHTSFAQKQIYDYISSIYNGTIEQNNRSVISPLELDIYLPDKQIAIEYCGLYWHSEANGKNKNYHLNKLKLCNDKGIRLITIFEDEWLNHEDISKDRLKHILGISNKICYARQTHIREISTLEYKEYINNHHIQGYIAAGIKIGAYYNNQLVAIMALGKLRKSMGRNAIDGQYELLRFATSGNIPGIASKLFSYFIKQYKPIEVTSYCDLRWGTGNLYKQMGFELKHISSPNYWYMKNYLIREYRFKYRKDILVKEGHDPLLTEIQIMKNKGYDRIWDCGNSVWMWKS